MLYKLIDGFPTKPPKEFLENGQRIVGFTDEFLKARGYKELKETTPTSEEQLDYYSEDDEFIYQEWK